MAQPNLKHDDAASQDGADKRRHKRRSGMWAAHLELGQDRRVGCVVLDLSDGGAKLLLKEPVAKGKIVTLISDRVGSRGGRVVWADGNRVGVEFLEGSADVVGIAVPYRPEFIVSPPPPPQPRPAFMDAQFLRGRADVLRNLAENHADPKKAALLMLSADAMRVEAAQIDQQQLLSGNG
jgi:PilZ domain-containing protein